jgi:hypothetical protein
MGLRPLLDRLKRNLYPESPPHPSPGVLWTSHSLVPFGDWFREKLAVATGIIFFTEADARQFQQVLPGDAGPLGREVFCREPWLFDDLEDDLNNLDNEDAPFAMALKPLFLPRQLTK